MPSTVRRPQCRPSPRAHQSHAPQARLISPTTRWPSHAEPCRPDHFAHEFMARPPAKTIVAAQQLDVGIADARENQPDQRESRLGAGPGRLPEAHATLFDVYGKHRRQRGSSPRTRLRRRSRALPADRMTGSCLLNSVASTRPAAPHFPIDDVLYACPRCGALLAVEYPGLRVDPAALKRTWRERRMSNAPLDQSGVWRYRELIPFLDFDRHAVATLREGNTPLLAAPRAAQYAGLDRLVFKHQGFNPTGSFKDNGMTCGASQALRLGHAARGLRLHRQHFGLHGRLCRRRRA